MIESLKDDIEIISRLQIPSIPIPSVRFSQAPQIEPQAPQVDVELRVAADAHLGPTPKEKGLDSRTAERH